MPKHRPYTLTPSDRIRIARQRVARQKREAARVDSIVSRRLENDIRSMMRDNRAGGF